MRAGDDLASLVADAVRDLPLVDGDVVAITQKVVSKAEGRVVEEGDPLIETETTRVVARRGDLVIAETRHGFVCANAGADRSNVAAGFVSLLPEDPDSSAEEMRRALSSRSDADVAVVITDTFGRPWRRGVVNVAIGCAGLPALVDLRGTHDANGRVLESTVVALADEIAAAAGLGMPKDAGIPAVVVRGVRRGTTSGRAREIVRPPEEDMFRESPLQSISSRRSIREFTESAIPRDVVEEAVHAALTAPVPHGSRHRERPWTWVVLERTALRRRLLAAMAAAWERDLIADGASAATIARRRERSDALLGAAPTLAIPAVRLDQADPYPDERRREAERDMFMLATGASVQSFMLALHAQGFASCWVSSTLFCREETREAIGLDERWLPMGAIAAGSAREPGPPRPPGDPGSHLRFG